MSETPNTMKPKMSKVIEAGETLIIRDSEGEEIAVEARHSKSVVEFLSAFDDLLVAERRGITGDVLAGIKLKVERSFANLPMSIQRELPSYRTMAARLTT